MKTFARLIRRYVFAAVGLGLLLPALCIGLLVWLGWQTGQYMPQWAYSSGAIADSMVSTADGLTFGAEHAPGIGWTVTRGPWRWMMTETCFGTITCPIC